MINWIEQEFMRRTTIFLDNLLDKESKKSCYELCPNLSSHDNVWFWQGYNKAVEIMRSAYPKP